MDNEYIHKVENFKKKVADRAETLKTFNGKLKEYHSNKIEMI